MLPRAFTLVLCVVPLALARLQLRPLPLMPPLPLTEAEKQPRIIKTEHGTAYLPALNTTYYFQQLVDHNDPSKGTFAQRYWVDAEWYHAGGPIVLATPGESDAEGFAGYVTNRSVIGQIAQAAGGASVLLEHRFFGTSNPRGDLSVSALQLLTVQQAIDDLEHFARSAVLPFEGGGAVAAGKAPWVLVGGSYSGALTAWTMVAKPGLFQAAYATSAVVETIVDFWKYFEPIRQFMPANCSADVESVVRLFDNLAGVGNLTGNATAFDALKTQFGMQDVEHIDDVTATLKNPLYAWQSLQPASGPNAPFYQFCDVLEVKDGKSAPAAGWGLEHAVQASGAWFKNTYLPSICGDDSYNDCLGTYNASSSYYTDTSLGNANRAWFWMVCNEFGWFQDSPPVGLPTIVSRTLQPSNQELRECQLMFPDAFSTAASTRINQISAILETDVTYKGWNLTVPNIFFANGKHDPWRDATLSADGLVPSGIPAAHIGLHDAGHVSDLTSANGDADASVRAVQQQGIKLVKQFLAGWKPSGGKGRRRMRWDRV